MKISLLPHTCSPAISPRITAPASLRHVFAVRSHCTAPEEARCAREICPFGARRAIHASTTHPGGPDGAARAFIEVSRGAPPKRASCGAPQLDPATPRPRDPATPSCQEPAAARESTLSETGCRGVAGSSCGAPQEAHFGGAPRYTSIHARAAPAGPPGRVVDARIAHRAPNGQTSPKNKKYLARRQKHVRRGSLVSPANLTGEKVTNFLLARRGHQGSEALFVYRYTLAVVRRDGRGNARKRHRRRPPFARDSRAQLAVARAPHPSRSLLHASAPGARETPPHSSLSLTGKQSAWALLSPPI